MFKNITAVAVTGTLGVAFLALLGLGMLRDTLTQRPQFLRKKK